MAPVDTLHGLHLPEHRAVCQQLADVAAVPALPGSPRPPERLDAGTIQPCRYRIDALTVSRAFEDLTHDHSALLDHLKVRPIPAQSQPLWRHRGQGPHMRVVALVLPDRQAADLLYPTLLVRPLHRDDREDQVAGPGRGGVGPLVG